MCSKNSQRSRETIVFVHILEVNAKEILKQYIRQEKGNCAIRSHYKKRRNINFRSKVFNKYFVNVSTGKIPYDYFKQDISWKSFEEIVAGIPLGTPLLDIYKRYCK